MTDDFDTLHGRYFVVLCQRYGEEQLIVFSTIQCTSSDIHVQFFGHDSGLIVDGDAVFVDTASGMAADGTYKPDFR